MLVKTDCLSSGSGLPSDSQADLVFIIFQLWVEDHKICKNSLKLLSSNMQVYLSARVQEEIKRVLINANVSIWFFQFL